MSLQPERAAEDGEMQDHLRQFLQENNEKLTGIICAYIVRMGLATGANVRLLAAEVFQDAAMEILGHAERLDPTRQPHAWFLRVAANILKRKRASFAKRYRFEVLVSDLATRRQIEDESEVLDQLMAAYTPGPEQDLEVRERVQEMLSLVSEADAQIIRLALLQDLDTERIARYLGVQPGAVRVRLHRALRRLRVAWHKRVEQEKRGHDYA